MPTQASAASNHKEEEPTAASSPHVSLLITPLEALCAQPLSLPWLQPLHVWATHWLALMARMSPTSQQQPVLLPATASTLWCLSQCMYLEHCGVSLRCMVGTLPLYVHSASWARPPTLPHGPAQAAQRSTTCRRGMAGSVL